MSWAYVLLLFYAIKISVLSCQNCSLSPFIALTKSIYPPKAARGTWPVLHYLLTKFLLTVTVLLVNAVPATKRLPKQYCAFSKLRLLLILKLFTMKLKRENLHNRRLNYICLVCHSLSLCVSFEILMSLPSLFLVLINESKQLNCLCS